MSRKVKKRSEKVEESQVAEDKGKTQPDIESSKTLEPVNKISENTETFKPTNLENISNKLDKLEELSMMEKEINDIKSEFFRLSTYAKIFFGIGIVALLIYCVNGVVTLLNYLKPK
jgi:hypothetical protein